MREIKFRAWDKVNKIMYRVQGLLCNVPMQLEQVKILGNWRLTENFLIMQFTGLLDQNGKEIYEGDIVRVDQDEEDSVGTNEYIGFIYWHNGECRYKYGTKRYKVLGEKDWFDYAEFPAFLSEHEVIGNIYEHKELLDGE